MTWGRDTDEHEATEQLTAFAEAGGTLVDTAPNYSDGDAERLIGRLLGGSVPRNELVIATKAGVGRRGDRTVVDTSRKAILDQLEDSLDRLDTDYVDLWQVHTWSQDAPLEETLAALDHAVDTGMARYVGICNYSGWQTAWAAHHQLAAAGRNPLVSSQVEYSLLARGVEREATSAAAQFGLGLLPWSPLGRGVLTGKYRAGTPADSRGASRHFMPFVEPYLDDRSRQIVEATATAADGLGAQPLEVALAWVRDRPGVTAPVLGARTAAQLRGALAAEDLVLPAEIEHALDEVASPTLGYPEVSSESMISSSR